MNDFFKKAGVMAIGTRLRMLSERVTKDSEKMLVLHGLDLKPKWFAVFYTLANSQEAMSVTAISQELGYAHPSVISILKEMKKEDLILEEKDKKDGRKTIISLTKKAQKISDLLNKQSIDVTNAIEDILSESTHNLWLAIEEFEKQMDEESIYSRVEKKKEKRELTQN